MVGVSSMSSHHALQRRIRDRSRVTPSAWRPPASWNGARFRARAIVKRYCRRAVNFRPSVRALIDHLTPHRRSCFNQPVTRCCHSRGRIRRSLKTQHLILWKTPTELLPRRKRGARGEKNSPAQNQRHDAWPCVRVYPPINCRSLHRRANGAGDVTVVRHDSTRVMRDKSSVPSSLHRKRRWSSCLR